MNKVAIVGLGYWGPNLVRNFLKVVGKENIVLCDTDTKKLEDISSKYDIKNCETKYDNILGDREVNAVVICTPAKTHFILAKGAILAGKHVLIEKPMTTSSHEAEELIRLSKDKKVVLMVDSTYLYNPAVLYLKELISSSDFGKIETIDSSRVNLGIFRRDVNVLWDLAYHDISILDFILDQKPLSIRVFGKDYTGTGQVDAAYICMEYRDSIVANVHVSWKTPIKIRQIIFDGSKQSIVWDDANIDEKIKTYNKSVYFSDGDIACRVGDVNHFKAAGKEALQLLVEKFIENIKNEEKDYENALRGLRIIKILEFINMNMYSNEILVRQEIFNEE